MKKILTDAYNHPRKKQCFYTGQNHPEVSENLGIEQWDWTPQASVNVDPWFWNTHTLALAFGCRPAFTSEGKEWIEHLITDPAQIADLEIPDPRAGRTGEILQKMEELLEIHPEDTLIRLPDIQSPLGVAELMWDQSFYLALITDPASVHALLEKIMQFTINYVNEIKKVLGPLYYHSCTWSDIYLDNIAKLEGVKALNWSFGTSTDPAIILERFSGLGILVPHFSLGIHSEEGVRKLNKNINSEMDLVKYLLDHMQDQTSLYFSFDEEFCDEVDRMSEIYHLFKRYGYAPYQA